MIEREIPTVQIVLLWKVKKYLKLSNQRERTNADLKSHSLDMTTLERKMIHVLPFHLQISETLFCLDIGQFSEVIMPLVVVSTLTDLKIAWSSNDSLK